MLLREAEAAFGEDGGEALLKTQGGDGERDGERPRVGLLLGLCRGEKAWSIRPLRSWNICFCKSKVNRCSLSSAEKVFMSGGRQGLRRTLPLAWGRAERQRIAFCSEAWPVQPTLSLCLFCCAHDNAHVHVTRGF